jgi:mannose-1-phosphate guanylyltransferase
MLGMTLTRARSLTAMNRILAMVRDEHRPWWEAEIADLRPENVLAMSRNRGTAVALLRALLHVHDRAPGACLVVLPSDHAVDNEDVLREVIFEAAEEARRNAEHVVLIGAPAGPADPTLGWILPGAVGGGRARAVARFVEKPDYAEAVDCVRRGAFRNTLMLAGGTRALLNLYAPLTLGPAGALEPSDEGLASSARELAAIYPHLPAMDLSRDLLQRAARWLRVVPLPECGWTDIGTLDRLEAWWMSHPAAQEQVRQSGILPIGAQAPSVARTGPVMTIGRNRPRPLRATGLLEAAPTSRSSTG